MILTILIDEGLDSDDFDLILEEDLKQIEKWGYQERHVLEWLAYTAEELGELARAMSENIYERGGSVEEIVKEAIQLATLAFKIAVMAKKELDKEVTDKL